MGSSASTIAGVVVSWIGSILAFLFALFIDPLLKPILRRVSEKLTPPHPLEPGMGELLEEVKGLRERVGFLRTDLAARPDAVVAGRGLSERVDLLRGDLAPRLNQLDSLRGLSTALDLLRETLAARPDPPAREITIRVIRAPRARRRRRGRPADDIE